MVRFILLFLVTLFLIAIDVRSENDDKVPSLNDFAFGITLEPMIGEGFYSFNVSDDVYKGVTRSDLGDTRIFNGFGAVVPSEVSVEESVSTKTSSKEVSLPLFPIEGSVGEGERSSSVEVSEDSKGNILSVRVESKNDGRNGAGTRREYLADLRGINGPTGTFELAWKGGEGKLLPVEAWRSDDLKSFRPYCAGVLAKLEFQGGEVRETALKCSEQASKYLKFSFPLGSEVDLESIRTTLQKTDVSSQPSSTLTLDALGTGQNGTVFLYDAQGLFPIHEVSVKFPDQNLLLDISISSRVAIEAPWIERVRFKGYSLMIDGLTVQSGGRALSKIVSDRYWKIETKDKEVKFSKSPTLELNWRPHRIYVLPTGEPPFTFAYGSRKVQGASHSSSGVRELIARSGASPHLLSLKEPHELGGTSLIAELEKDTSIDEWRKWALWGILAVVLAVVLIMALRLSKELQ